MIKLSNLYKDEEIPTKVIGFSFPAYRSAEWLERHRLMSAVPGCLVNVAIEPKSLGSYAYVRAYELKAEKVRAEIRDALFRQALFKVQNIEVVASKKCPNDRVLLQITKKARRWPAVDLLRKNALISEEVWHLDRCGSIQRYKVRYYREGDDGFRCKVYPTSLENFLNFIRYYLSF
ncbi:uncharacterized protein BXIN_0894 [Babesia sp. Xinjiang]|uniref:uncharacterized protein n=1 Tax=Babesia sp. Xinjiang TaxID=462227 RepID=UPI000A259ADF|nr:uncharacterized protein BXIN_0894 [Babesia sp. Xinjiang]ORM41238.1 hypothetical protein BXIN_0894 [Babesia sp. Xinjiang]